MPLDVRGAIPGSGNNYDSHELATPPEDSSTVHDDVFRLLLVNYLAPDLTAGRSLSAVLPGLEAQRPNPSSERPGYPIENALFDPHPGRPFFFDGHFTATASSAMRTEQGIPSNLFEVSQDPGTPGDATNAGEWVPIDYGPGNIDYSNGWDLALELQRYMNGQVTTYGGTYFASDCVFTVRYTNERYDEDNPTFAFRFECNYPIKLRQQTSGEASPPPSPPFAAPSNNYGLSNIGHDDGAAFSTAFEGSTCLHSEEWIVFDLSQGHSSRQHVMGGTFDGAANLMQSDGFRWFVLVNPTITWDQSTIDPVSGGGYSKMYLHFSTTLADLENLDLSGGWTEGLDQFTFHDMSLSAAPGVGVESPWVEVPYLGVHWGTDSAGHVRTQDGMSPDYTQPRNLPCRYLVADLFKWARAEGQNEPKVGSPWKYMRLTIVNRGNPTGHIGFSHIYLGPGWYPRYEWNRQFTDAIVDRSSLVELPGGQRVPNRRRPGRMWAWSFDQAWMHARDKLQLDSIAFRPMIADGQPFATSMFRDSEEARRGRSGPALLLDLKWDPFDTQPDYWTNGVAGVRWSDQWSTTLFARGCAYGYLEQTAPMRNEWLQNYTGGFQFIEEVA